MASLQHTITNMEGLLNTILHDLTKAKTGNKAASQRVRTNTVRLEKTAKSYRKESIHSEKGTKSTGRKTTKKAATKPAKAKHTMARSTASRSSTTSKTKAKTKAKSAFARPRALSFKKSTAKLPLRRAAR